MKSVVVGYVLVTFQFHSVIIKNKDKSIVKAGQERKNSFIFKKILSFETKITVSKL